MKNVLLTVLAAFALVSFNVAPSLSADCNGPWQRGGTCKSMGLDTHRGTCLPGQPYETLCDDSRGLYRTCPGPRPCAPAAAPGNMGAQNNCANWDYNYNTPCPPGFVNYDCQGGCERAR